jgi:hypothetical protein
VIKVRWNALSGQYRDVKNKNIEHRA